MTTINIRIDEELKIQALKTLNKIGLDMSSAVKLFLQQVVNNGAIPFKPKTKNAYILELEAEVQDAIKNGKGYKSAEQMHRAILGNKVYDSLK
jgi:DNA-damage-inducible protein J